jgi:hypothetical protein
VSISLRQVEAGVSKNEQARPKARALPKIERDMQSRSVENVRKRVGQTNDSLSFGMVVFPDPRMA